MKKSNRKVHLLLLSAFAFGTISLVNNLDVAEKHLAILADTFNLTPQNNGTFYTQGNGTSDPSNGNGR